MASLAT